MKHTYYINGMTCQGCRAHVEESLSEVEGVLKAEVDLNKKEAVIEMSYHVDLNEFQSSLDDHGGRYTISHTPQLSGHDHKISTHQSTGEGIYYCPMQCEGDKTYKKAGDCPVCGMDLVREVKLQPAEDVIYTCPMHPEIETKEPGACPICGMDLVLRAPKLSEEQKHFKSLLLKFWWALVFTLPIFIIAMSEMIPSNPLYRWMPEKYWNFSQFALSLPVVFYSTWMFFQRAYRSIRTWNLNMFTLIGIGAGVAWLFSAIGLFLPDIFPDQFKTDSGNVYVYFEAATVILTLVLLGQVLEAKAHTKTSSAIKELLQLAPNKAYKIVDGQETEVNINSIMVGDILRVKPGDKIAVDGIIIEGSTSIDESMISGEPIPVAKTTNDRVISGTINGNQSFLMKAEKVGSDTLLSQIIQMVNDASRSRAPIQNLADVISGYFVPVVVLISIVTFIVWSVWGPAPAYVYGLVNAIAVLIIACPCALGLATPMSVMVGVGKGAKNGVLFKNAAVLQQMSQVTTLLIDKTGTITEGKPSVEKVVTYNNNCSEEELIRFAASLNQFSEHPLAESMVKHAKETEIELVEANNFEALSGLGVSGTVQNRDVVLGSIALMEKMITKPPADLLSEVVAVQKMGKTVSFLAVEGTIWGYLVITDAIKETSKETLSILRKKGLEIFMLTGDNQQTAQYVADQLPLSGFRAELTPEDKLLEVKRLQTEGRIVAMAGDGINDAPALAQSNVGIAMGTGTDVAIESADITLVKGDLIGILKAFNLSKAVMKNIKQNLFFALIYNALGVPVAAGVLYPYLGVLLSPMIAAAAMSFSSVSVIGNALRLRTKKL